TTCSQHLFVDLPYDCHLGGSLSVTAHAGADDIYFAFTEV
ncbi:MAG: hypothetical protein RL518_1027, partial [Pseudomonadota bacterium]